MTSADCNPYTFGQQRIETPSPKGSGVARGARRRGGRWLTGLARRLSGAAVRCLLFPFASRPNVGSLAGPLVKYGELHLEGGTEADLLLARRLVDEAAAIYGEMGRSLRKAEALDLRSQLDAALAGCVAREDDPE